MATKSNLTCDIKVSLLADRALATIPVFWSSETEEAKNCLSQLHFPAQPEKTDRRVFLAPSQMNQNAWDFASALEFFGSFLVKQKRTTYGVRVVRHYLKHDIINTL